MRKPKVRSQRGSTLLERIADDGHAADGSDAAGCDDQAGGEGGVAEQLLIEERKDGDGGVDADAEHEDEDAADEEVAIFEDFEIDEGVFAAPAVPEEVEEGDDEEEGGPADPGGAEPVVFLALVEDDLQAAGPDDERGEAVAVERRRPWLCRCRRDRG